MIVKPLSRRDFLAATGVAALGLVARPAWLRAATLPAITKAIPASGERLPVIGMGTSRTFDVAPDSEQLRSCCLCCRRSSGTGAA